ncbi:hypothetical protein [Nocardia cyriacigeorgica]|nr:hypothetical protein [Nocardia cyriacigeorgica]
MNLSPILHDEVDQLPGTFGSEYPSPDCAIGVAAVLRFAGPRVQL